MFSSSFSSFSFASASAFFFSSSVCSLGFSSSLLGALALSSSRLMRSALLPETGRLAALSFSFSWTTVNFSSSSAVRSFAEASSFCSSLASFASVAGSAFSMGSSFASLSSVFLADLRAARFAGSFHSMCLACQLCRSFCHWAHLSLNHSLGVKSSMRVVILRSCTHVFRCFLQASGGCQQYSTSSKPSFSGKVKLEKQEPRTCAAISGSSDFLNFCCLSSSVSSTFGGSSSGSASIFGSGSSSSMASSSFCSSPSAGG
mmetsp:Transcript_105937/g.188415  ORF Transcript_105937/g.188415 Transcript_105937/m.188415 type:complete len:259 (-) Transcript_105937:1471-2247(-)